ncbi:MAG: type II secretion system minor pseudopilin GspK [Gammaproteobacteria bacterium]|nr:type II secretion system minor pseudopilin GspK [Gammaproteobacteria bacterium]
MQISPFVANRVADWIDPNLNALADGAEDLLYLGLGVPYRTANRLMASPSELAAVAGLSRRDVSALLPLVTALPKSTPINVNTAPEMVLLSLHEDITPRIAAELAAMRVGTAFETVDEFVKKLKDDYGITLDKKLVSVSSEYFLVTSDAAIGRTTLRMYSLLERKDNDTVRVMSRGIGSY